MKTVGILAVAMAIVCLIAAIWIPALWWQLVVTGLLLLVAGGALLGQEMKQP